MASGFHLGENEILQLYKKAYDEDVAYGYGVKYRLLAPQFKLKAEKTITGETILLAGSIIAKGSKIKKEDWATQVIDQYTDGNIVFIVFEASNLESPIFPRLLSVGPELFSPVSNPLTFIMASLPYNWNYLLWWINFRWWKGLWFNR